MTKMRHCPKCDDHYMPEHFAGAKNHKHCAGCRAEQLDKRREANRKRMDRVRFEQGVKIKAERNIDRLMGDYRLSAERLTKKWSEMT